MPDFKSYIICNGIAGFGVGLFQSAALSIITEVNAIPYRANFYTYICLSFDIGGTASVGLAFWLLSSTDPSTDLVYWREMIIITAGILLPAVVLSFVYLRESPRYLISKEKFAAAEQVLDSISKSCQKGPLSKDEKIVINEMKVSKGLPFWSAVVLMYTKHATTTLQINYTWFSIGVCFYGILYLAPKALADITSNSLICLLIITASQLFSKLVPIFGIESPSLGRRRIMIGSQTVYTIMVLLTAFIENTLFIVIGYSIGIVMIMTNLIVIWTYTCEAYPTKMRGIALSVN